MSGSAARGSAGGDFTSHDLDSGRKNMGYFRSARLAQKHTHPAGHPDAHAHSNVPDGLGRFSTPYHTNPTAPGAAGHRRAGVQGEVSSGGGRRGVKDSDTGKRAGKLY